MQENEIGTPAPAERGGTALVTGANSGIGREIARQLLALGWTVHVGARDRARGQAAVDELGSGAQLALIDATDDASIAAAASAVEQLDVLVNNAGITDDGSPAPQSSVGTFRRVYETNVFGVVAVTNAFLPALRRSAHPRIVNISSGTGSLGWSSGPNPQFPFETGGTSAAYRSSKTALNALTVFYAQALAPEGFRVNALAPGLRATNLIPALRDLDPASPLAARMGDPAEAATGAVRLALLPDDGPTGSFFSWDGSAAPW